MASSALAIRSAVASLSGLAGRFVAVFAGLREAALGVRAGLLFSWVFSTFSQFLTAQP